MLDGDPLRRARHHDGIIGSLVEIPIVGLQRAIAGYNRVRGSERYRPPTDRPELRAVQRRAREPSDISDHLERLFVEALRASPGTIVELGVRDGESTFVFERVARLADADLVSVDIDATTHDSTDDRWRFVESNDIEFAGEFEEWCADNRVDPAIDVLFVDTSHRYDHTVAEIDAWFPHLADDAVVLFHDTNMARLYRREDGTVGLGWNNDRGVVRAIEDRFDCSLDETESFVTLEDGFVLEQYPHCSGLAVLRKLDVEGLS